MSGTEPMTTSHGVMDTPGSCAFCSAEITERIGA